MDRRALQELLSRNYVLFSCEGGAETVVMDKLISAGRLCVPQHRIVKDPVSFTPYTRCRKASDIAERFLGTNYMVDGADGLVLARIVDSRSAQFSFPRAWRGSAEVRSFYTRPEIEMLIILNEGAYDAWQRALRSNHGIRPSEFCKTEMRMKDVKRPSFLESYWDDVDGLENSIRRYAQCRGKHRADEPCLADLLV